MEQAIPEALRELVALTAEERAAAIESLSPAAQAEIAAYLASHDAMKRRLRQRRERMTP